MLRLCGRFCLLSWWACLLPSPAQAAPSPAERDATALPAGAVAVMSLSSVTENGAGTPPKVTLVAPVKPLLVIWTELPPAVGPALTSAPPRSSWEKLQKATPARRPA